MDGDLSVAHAHVPKYAGLNGDRLRWAITGTATIGFLLFGYDQGVMSGIVSLLMSTNIDNKG